jgi:hypothetical protein
MFHARSGASTGTIMSIGTDAAAFPVMTCRMMAVE